MVDPIEESEIDAAYGLWSSLVEEGTGEGLTLARASALATTRLFVMAFRAAADEVAGIAISDVERYLDG